MGPCGQPQVSPVELMHALKADRATFVNAELFCDFLPRLAVAALLPDELDVRFEPTVIGTSAALPGSLVCLRVIHVRKLSLATVSRRAVFALGSSGRVRQNGAGVK